jgi:hypothetical protein
LIDKAITQNSILVCDTGGLLSPIFSYAAKKYAQQIDSNNGKEIFQCGCIFFGGAGIVIAGAEMGIAKTLLWMGVTMGVMNELSYWEKKVSETVHWKITAIIRI